MSDLCANPALAEQIRQAIDREQLFLHYQPQRELESGRIVAAEALLRWRHPRRGTVGPDEILSIANEAALTLEVGAYVLEEACLQCRAWLDRGVPPLRVAVNLSAAQLLDPGFAEWFWLLLTRYAVPAQWLELEVTESPLVYRRTAVRENLTDLERLGVQLAIDDFGTGWASLEYLRAFPVSKLKIARELVADVVTHERDRTIVTAVIGLGQALGVTVLAEGIECPEQRDLLLRQGCALGQGFLLGRPMPAAELEEELLEHAAAAPVRCSEPSC